MNRSDPPDYEFALTDKELVHAVADYLVKTNRIASGRIYDTFLITTTGQPSVFKAWKEPSPCV